MKLSCIRVIALVASLMFAVGCQPTADSTSKAGGSAGHDTSGAAHGHSHSAETPAPKTFKEGFELLSKQHAAIKTAFEAESPEDAHGALHDVGHVLESLTTLAASNPDISPSLDAIKQYVEQLFEQFGLLDETLHGGNAVEFSEVNQEIETALASLKEFAQ